MRKEAQEYKLFLLSQIKDAARSQNQAAAESASSGMSPTAQNITRKLLNASAVMQQGLVEREVEVRRCEQPTASCSLRLIACLGSAVQVRLLLLAAMSGEHILLIGPPGTAKSEVGRRLNRLISGTYFERLLTRFSVPEVAPLLLGAMLLP